MNETTLTHRLKLPIKLTIFGAHNVGKTSIIVRLIESRFLESHYPTTRENHFSKSINIAGDNRDIYNHSMANLSLGRHLVNLEIIDTMGQDYREQSNLKVEYAKSFRNLDGLILCYNVGDIKSFHVLESIRDKLINHFEIDFTKDSDISSNSHTSNSISNANNVKENTLTTTLSNHSVQSAHKMDTRKVTSEQGPIPLLIIGNKSDLLERQVSESEGRTLAKQLNAVFFECSAKDNYNIDESFEAFIRCIEQEKHQSSTAQDENKCVLM